MIVTYIALLKCLIDMIINFNSYLFILKIAYIVQIFYIPPVADVIYTFISIFLKSWHKKLVYLSNANPKYFSSTWSINISKMKID